MREWPVRLEEPDLGEQWPITVFPLRDVIRESPCNLVAPPAAVNVFMAAAFGLPADLPLWVDGRVMTRDRIILGGGGRDRKVLATPAILTALEAEVVEGLAFEPS